MARRKNTRRFDPRYFMDEKTDVIKEEVEIEKELSELDMAGKARHGGSLVATAQGDVVINISGNLTLDLVLPNGQTFAVTAQLDRGDLDTLRDEGLI